MSDLAAWRWALTVNSIAYFAVADLTALGTYRRLPSFSQVPNNGPTASTHRRNIVFTVFLSLSLIVCSDDLGSRECSAGFVSNALDCLNDYV